MKRQPSSCFKCRVYETSENDHLKGITAHPYIYIRPSIHETPREKPFVSSLIMVKVTDEELLAHAERVNGKVLLITGTSSSFTGSVVKRDIMLR
jgi:hypothetical protein